MRSEKQRGIFRHVLLESVWKLARAVLEMAEELRKAAESGKEKP